MKLIEKLAEDAARKHLNLEYASEDDIKYFAQAYEAGFRDAREMLMDYLAQYCSGVANVLKQMGEAEEDV